MRPVTGTRRTARPRAIGALLLVAVGCAQDTGVSEDELASIRAWLTCDDCRSGERERVEAIGMRAAPLLVEAILDFPDARRENLRAQYSQLYATLPAPAMDSASFVDRYLGAFDLNVRTRAALSLGDLGAFDELQDVVDTAEARGWSADAVAVLEGNLLRDFAGTTEGPGPADTWAIDTPLVAVEVCNGSGGIPCTDEHVVQLRARATAPSGVTPPPWESVYFFVREDPSGPPAMTLLGRSADPTVTDDGLERRFDWRYDFGAVGLPPGPVEIYAVGVTPSGQAFRTPAFTLVTVVEGT